MCLLPGHCVRWCLWSLLHLRQAQRAISQNTSLCLSVSVHLCLSACLLVCLSIHLSVSVCRSVCRVSLSVISVSLSLSLSVCLSVFVSAAAANLQAGRFCPRFGSRPKAPCPRRLTSSQRRPPPEDRSNKRDQTGLLRQRQANEALSLQRQQTVNPWISSRRK